MKKLALSLVALATLVTISCKKDEESAKSGKVNLSFDHKVGSEQLEFDTLKYINAVGHEYEVTKLVYFLSNITFNKSNGTAEIVKGPIYIDAEDPTKLEYNGTIELPVGTYSSIGVTFGIDSNMNVTDTLTTVEEVAMAWPEPMGGGYHYMKLEGTYDSLGLGVIKNYKTHTGPTMGKPYYFDVTFDNSAFTINEDGMDLTITMDVNEWYTDPTVYDFATYGPAIMGNMDAQMVLKGNGQSVFSVSVE